MTRNDTDSLNN